MTNEREPPHDRRCARAAYDGQIRVVDVFDGGGLAIVVIEGELDIGCVATLQRVLSRVSIDSHVMLDVAGVVFIDCRGLRVLVGQSMSRNAARGSLRLRNSSACVRRLLDITGLDDLLLECVPEDNDPTRDH